MQIKGAIALVTGGAKGIGYSFCVALLEHGAKAVSSDQIYIFLHCLQSSMLKMHCAVSKIKCLPSKERTLSKRLTS